MMNKCKFAFDQQDPLCQNCNGIKFKLGEEEFDSIECVDFQPETSNEEESTEKVESETTDEGLHALAQVSQESLDTVNAVHITELKTTKPYTVKTITYRSSTTVKAPSGDYYKFEACEEWQLEPGADVQAIREQLWNKLNSEVDKQVDDVLTEG